MIRRIHVRYELTGVTPEQEETALRVHGFHAGFCPVARSIESSIDITTELVLVQQAGHET